MKERYYIQSRGELQRDRNTLRFKNENTDTRLPIERVYDIFAEEGVSISSGTLELLSEKEIILHSFGYYGNYVVSFTPKEAVMSGECMVKQAEHYNDNEKRMTIAKKIVEGSIQNMRYTLMRYKDDCCSASEKMDDRIANISQKDNISELMQLEGECKKDYYNCLNHQINDFELKSRYKQPPVGEVNAMISYLNSLIYASIVSELYKTRLDQKISFLHEPLERRFSLSLDISEIFKPMISDRLVVSLLNQRIIDTDDFHEKGKGTFLTEKGRKTVVSKFKERMSDTRKHLGTRKNYSIRRWIRMECHSIMKHILGVSEYRYTTIR